MSELVNVYCDESCHLERDGQSAMVFGAVWCLADKRKEIADRIAEIRARHGMPADFEFKWTKVGPAKLQMYMDLVDYFFDDDDLKFRCLVIPNKKVIDHTKFNQSHDDWYYKMYFNMLKTIFKPTDAYHIYLDIKDTRSEKKVRHLHDVLCNNAYDFSRNVIRRVQQIRSHEVLHMQITDILIGAISYKARGMNSSKAKMELIDRIAKRSGYSLERSTLYREEKFNIFVWRGSEE
jgi:hypothetical protein